MQVKNIPLSEITPSALNPRKTFDADEIQELAKSIKENGLIQPITIRKAPKGTDFKYEIVCGERRFRACTYLGMETIEAVVKPLDDKQAFVCMVLENLQRRDIDPLEEAAAIQHLYKEGQCTIAEIGKLLGKSNTFVNDRIRLNNIIPEFAELLKNKILGIFHLLHIAKLPKEQQHTLYDTCFQPEHIARWTEKILKPEILYALIDEHVMNALCKARFNPADTTYNTCGSCEGCKFNTASSPKRFNDTDHPRCMKREFFLAKNREAVIRQGKISGLPIIYAGTAEENAELITAAKEMGLDPQPLGKREYIVLPAAPKEESYPDREYYLKRLANYQDKIANFEDNIKDGTVIKVYELSFNGNLSGEEKNIYNVSVDENGEVAAEADKLVRGIDNAKKSLRATDENERAEVTEKKRVLLSESDYSSDNSELSEKETAVFLSIILKRMAYPFKKALGLDFQTALDTDKSFPIAVANSNAIIREFIKLSLSEESVGFSTELASLLSQVVGDRFAEQSATIESDTAKTYNTKRDKLRATINALQEQLNPATPAEVASELQAETSSTEDVADEIPATEETSSSEDATTENA